MIIDRWHVGAGLALAVGGIAAVVVTVLELAALLVISLLILLAVVSVPLLRDVSRGNQIFVFALGVALAVRLVAIWLLPEFAQMKFGEIVISTDSGFYHRVASNLAKKPLTDWQFNPFRFIDRDPGYAKFLGLLYRAFGPHLVLGRLFNLVLTIPLLAYTYRVAERVFDDQVANITVLTVALWPSLVFLTARIGHDIVAITLTMAAFYYAFRLVEADRQMGPVLALLTTLLLLYLFRNQVAYVLVVVFSIWALFQDRSDAAWPTLRPHLVLSGAVIAGILLLIALHFQIGPFARIHERLNAWSIWFLENEAGPESGLASVVIGLPLVVRLFVGSAVFGIVPFPPWKVLLSAPSIPASFYATSAIVLYVIAPFSIIGAIRSLHTANVRSQAPLFFFLITIWALVAMWYGGTATRFRSQVIILVIIFASAGIAHANRYHRLIGGYLILMILGIASYYAIKLMSLL